MDVVAPENYAMLETLDLDPLMRHIIDKYHDFSREMLAKLQELFLQNGDGLWEIFRDFKHNFELHLMKEEKILFPFIQALGMQKEDSTVTFTAKFPHQALLFRYG